ncbi:MAG: acyl-CoA dehydrogenase family protein [Gordonia sp. (in: high G+C Gram-positive bacteria)]|uniref:acyl-CoA dehydrogenase family protein n=1 Tax=Gordonia sp. (in: high G+C Gram-positive bacteria) TaxID=84139 RepID=UPI0039E344A2
MDFELSDEQAMLRDTVHDLLTRKYDIETLRSTIDTDPGWSSDVWKQLADIGILGLVFDEADGGAGAGDEELAAVMTEIGSALAPEPFLDSVVVPGLLATYAGMADDARQEFVGGLASGEKLSAFAHHEAGDRWPDYAVATTAGDGAVTGVKTLVGHGDCADSFVVSAREGNDVGLYLVDAKADGVTVSPYRTNDGRRGARVEFAGAPGTRIGSGDASKTIEHVDVVTQAALCAEAVGAMSRALDMTVEYLKTRKQFGVPLATFQALTHRAANMYAQLELARSMSVYATAALSGGTVDPIIASRAKLQVCRGSRLVGQEAIQMHGGIGVTAEYPVAHYVARLTAIARTLGDADAHLANLSSHVSDWDMVTVG